MDSARAFSTAFSRKHRVEADAEATAETTTPGKERGRRRALPGACVAVWAAGLCWLAASSWLRAPPPERGGGGAVYSRSFAARLAFPSASPPNASLPRVAACARVRNEGRYLREWLEFHLEVGVSHFYVFDDDSTDDTRAVLAPYAAAGVASVWPVVDDCRAERKKKTTGVCADRRHDALHGEKGFRDECLRANPARAQIGRAHV